MMRYTYLFRKPSDLSKIVSYLVPMRGAAVSLSHIFDSLSRTNGISGDRFQIGIKTYDGEKYSDKWLDTTYTIGTVIKSATGAICVQTKNGNTYNLGKNDIVLNKKYKIIYPEITSPSQKLLNEIKIHKILR